MGRKWKTKAGIAAILMAAFAMATMSAGCNDESPSTLAFAVSLDADAPGVNVFYGDLQKNPLRLPGGRYYVALTGQDDAMMAFVTDIEEGQPISLAPISGDGAADPEQADALRTLATFATELELARLQLMESLSAQFTAPLLTPASEADSHDLTAFFAANADLLGQEDALRSALATLDEGALQVRQPVRYVSAGSARTPQLLSDLMDSYLPEFFNRIRKLPERERQRVLEIVDHMNATQRGEFFNSLPANLKGETSNFDEWLDEVSSGQRDDQLGAIHGTLYTVETGATQAAGHTPNKTMAEEGVPLMEAGAKFELEAYGKVPGVSKALEVTDKIKKWDSYLQKLYEGPAGAAANESGNDYQRILREQIKRDLADAAPGLSEGVLNSLSAQLAAQIIKVMPVPPGGGSASTGGKPNSKPSPTPTPPGWIQEVVQQVAQRLLSSGVSGIAAAIATDDLRLCLSGDVAAGFTQKQALIDCADFMITQYDHAWIDAIVSKIAQDLLGDGFSGIEVAVITDDLRLCLADALQNNLSRATALNECAMKMQEPCRRRLRLTRSRLHLHPRRWLRLHRRHRQRHPAPASIPSAG